MWSWVRVRLASPWLDTWRREATEWEPRAEAVGLQEHGNTSEGGGERVIRPVILGPNARDSIPSFRRPRCPRVRSSSPATLG